MSYLYGDSTPSTLEVNYIEFLRDAVEFCVQVLLADQRIGEGKARTRALDQATAAEIVKLQKVGTLVPKAFEGVPFGEPESAAARCVGAIVRSAGDLVRVATAEVRSARDAEVSRCEAEAVRERELCVKALEGLLVKHDLPEMSSDLHVALVGSGRYACRAHVTTKFGLEAVLELEVPANHLFERVVRVDRLMERLEVQVPEIGGWLHKEMKLRGQHLEKQHVTELSLAATGSKLKLRAAPDGTGPGFDVLYPGDGSPMRLARADQQDNEPFDVDAGDVPNLRALREKLAAAAAELTAHRKAVVEAKVDSEPLRDHPKPALLVERLIATLAPVVQEISTRSQSPGELVLRRLLGGGRREEIFLSKQELKEKLAPLAEANRTLFDPLWLEGVGLGAPPASHGAPLASHAPPPPPPASLGAPPSPASHATATPPASHATTTPPASHATATPPASHAAPPTPSSLSATTTTPPASPSALTTTTPGLSAATPTPPSGLPATTPPASPTAAPPPPAGAGAVGASLAAKPAAAESPPAGLASKPSGLAAKLALAEPPPAASPIARPPTPRFGMSPLAMAIAEGAAAAPPPAPPPRDESRGRATTGSIELTRAPTPARLLDRPPPTASRADVEVTFEEKAPEPGRPPSRD